MSKWREEQTSPSSWLARFIQEGLVLLVNPLSVYQCQSIQTNSTLPSKAKVSLAIANERWEKKKIIAAKIEVSLLVKT